MATLGEFVGSGSGTTKLLLHLNGNATDSSGNGNNGTVNGATVVDGKFGKCYSFDGTNDVINLGTGISLTNNFTISLFIKTTNTLNDKSIISKEKVGSEFPQFLAILKSNGLINFSVFNTNSPSVYISLDSVSAINDGLYKNIILTRDGSFANIYINGKLDSKMAWTNSQWNSTANVCIGASQSSSGFTKFLNCLIDEVIIENRAWTPQEVAKYYTMTKGRFGII
jgi:hypothetical protein